MKRFYTAVSLLKSADGFGVSLDGKPIKTPGKYNLVAPNIVLAQHVCAEWEAQRENIDPETMPLTQLLSTKIDYVSKNRADIEVALLKYIESDLLFYLAPEPAELMALQGKHWKPWHDWIAALSGSLPKTTFALNIVDQDQSLIDFIACDIKSLSLDQLTLLQAITVQSGSLILAMAFLHNEMSVDTLLRASFVEEDYKNIIYDAEKYGEDPTQKKARNELALLARAARTYLESLTT